MIFNLRDFIKTAEPLPTKQRPRLSARTPTASLVQEQIKTKIDTFINWDLQASLNHRKTLKLTKKDSQTQELDLMKVLLKFTEEMKRKEKLFKTRRHGSSVENIPISENQRERFAKMSNPLEFIQYYTKNHKFQPKQHQKILINKLVEIKALLESMQSLHLQKVLSQIYHLMNMIVDFNQLRLLIVVIVLAAEVCYQVKDSNRAVYFYHQAVIMQKMQKMAAEISSLPEIVTESLIGLSKVCYDLGLSTYSIKFLKKALAYSWQQNDQANQTQIYDILGQNYCLQGKMNQAKYYHERFIQNYTERQSSAIRKIYIEIIKDDAKDRNFRLYSQNVDLLFLQTVSLPIWNFDKIPFNQCSMHFENFIDGQSPRKNLTNKNFDYQVFDDAELQVKKILQKSQFKKEMPNPNIQTLYTPSHRYGKRKRDVQFSKTVQFRQITHTKLQTDSPHQNRKYSIEKQIQLIMSDKPDPNWFSKISENVKRQRQQKLGSLKEPVRRTHLKTPQKKRTTSTQSENIRKSINKAILSWIDPPQ